MEAIIRKQTSFRLREDLLKVFLKIKSLIYCVIQNDVLLL